LAPGSSRRLLLIPAGVDEDSTTVETVPAEEPDSQTQRELSGGVADEAGEVADDAGAPAETQVTGETEALSEPPSKAGD